MPDELSPEGERVRRLGTAAVQGKCDSGMPGTCIAKDRGPVSPYQVAGDGERIQVCEPCMEALIDSGEWVFVA